MANIAIYEKDSDEIRYFILDCVRRGRDFRGSNGSVTGVKANLFNEVWTEDIATYDPDTETWDKTISDLTPCTHSAVIKKTDKKEYQKAVLLRAKIGTMTYEEMDAYIDGLNGMSDIKQAIKLLYKAVLAVIKVQDREL